MLSDPTYALMIPAPLQGRNPQVVRFLHGQYVHGVERRYVRGGTITLAPTVDYVMIISFVGWCESGLSQTACEEYAWSHGDAYYHDEPRLCIQNPSASVPAACDMQAGGVATQEYASPNSGDFSFSATVVQHTTYGDGLGQLGDSVHVQTVASGYSGVPPLTYEYYSSMVQTWFPVTSPTAAFAHQYWTAICAAAGCGPSYGLRVRDGFGFTTPVIWH